MVYNENENVYCDCLLVMLPEYLCLYSIDKKVYTTCKYHTVIIV